MISSVLLTVLTLFAYYSLLLDAASVPEDIGVGPRQPRRQGRHRRYPKKGRWLLCGFGRPSPSETISEAQSFSVANSTSVLTQRRSDVMR